MDQTSIDTASTMIISFPLYFFRYGLNKLKCLLGAFFCLKNDQAIDNFRKYESCIKEVSSWVTSLPETARLWPWQRRPLSQILSYPDDVKGVVSWENHIEVNAGALTATIPLKKSKTDWDLISPERFSFLWEIRIAEIHLNTQYR